MALYLNERRFLRWIDNDFKYFTEIMNDIENIDKSDNYSEQSVKLFFDEKIKKSILLENKWKYRMKKYDFINKQNYYNYELQCLINAHTNVKNFIIQREEELGIEKSSYLMENIPLCEIVDEPNKK